MPIDTENTGSSSLLSTITRLLDNSLSAGAGLDNLITVLSLLCLISIVNRNQAVSQPPQLQAAANTGNPLHKLLGDLAKSGGGDGGGLSPDSLMSLLPLLNSPQIKSKLNPSTIGSVLGLINNMGGLGSSPPQEKTKPETKVEAKTDSPKIQKEEELSVQQATAVQQPMSPSGQSVPPHGSESAEETEGKNHSRYLNWKNNF